MGEISDLVEAVAGLPPSRGFARAVLERSGGNPFYVHEVLKTAWADQALTANAGEIASTMDLEQGILESIARHLETLSERARTLLTLAAVLGKRFQMVQLRVASRLEATELIDLLAEATRAELLFEDGGWFGFNHVLVRDVLYKRLTSGERSEHHRVVAERLAEHYGAAAKVHASELAEHFTRALPRGDAERAVEMAMCAASQKAEFGRPREAAKHWLQAAHACSLLAREDPRRAPIQIGLARAYMAAGQLAEARECFADAAIVSRAFSLAEGLAESALGYVSLTSADSPQGQILLEQAFAGLANVPGSRDLRARVEAALSGRDR